jgi:hypothetical protein
MRPPAPLGPCNACRQAIAERGPLRHQLGLEYFYCQHNQCLCWWQVDFWQMFNPVSEAEALPIVEVAAKEISQAAAADEGEALKQ